MRLRLPWAQSYTYPTHARRMRDLADAYARTVGPLVREAVALWKRGPDLSPFVVVDSDGRARRLTMGEAARVVTDRGSLLDILRSA